MSEQYQSDLIFPLSTWRMVDIVHKNLRMNYQYDSAGILAKKLQQESQSDVKSHGK